MELPRAESEPNDRMTQGVRQRAVRPRPYRMRKRQEDVEETRRRIVEAAVELHGSQGPRYTTFSAVAARAGVQRSTLYRHFPDEESLFAACTGHWLAASPPPDPRAWRELSDPALRLEHGVQDLYRYFAGNAAMLANSFRDLDVLPPSVTDSISSWFGEMHAALLEPWPAEVRESRDVAAAIRHAIDFRTWQSLVEAGLDTDAAAGLIAAMVTAVATDIRRQKAATDARS